MKKPAYRSKWRFGCPRPLAQVPKHGSGCKWSTNCGRPAAALTKSACDHSRQRESIASAGASTGEKMGDRTKEPRASRPYMPDYGIAKGKKGLRPWSFAREKL